MPPSSSRLGASSVEVKYWRFNAGIVDLVHGAVRVEQAWVVPPGGRPVVGAPKSESGRRILNVPEHVVPALAHHLQHFVGPGPECRLFGTSTGTAVSSRNFQRVWDDARKAVGRPDLHLHDLRHSGLTWSAATGASVAELMRRGGHASPRAALRYQHATEDRDKAIAYALSALATGLSRVIAPIGNCFAPVVKEK